MITIDSTVGKNEYDIHSLTKAFYPEEEVRIRELNNGTAALKDPVETGSAELVFHMETGDIINLQVPYNNRDELKRRIYHALSARTGKTLPWGALTGIRPVKMVRERLEGGMDDMEALQDMKERYLISDEKGRLALDIAKRETELIRPLSYADHYSIYIDVPFCPTRCLYCSFTSNAVGEDRSRVLAYLEALKKEMEASAGILAGRRIDTIYIGGGTPTALLPDELRYLLGMVADAFDTDGIAEYTVEAGRPDSITREKLKVLAGSGVDRISVNPQTMNQKTLDIIGRRHTVEQVEEAFLLARDEGFSNINMDMILGLPGEKNEDVQKTVDMICSLGPDSLTIHSLAVKRASALRDYLEERGYGELSDTEEMMDIAIKGAVKMGMHPYYLYRQKNMSGNLENTGYALDGRYGLYNILINEEIQDILALGSGAISKRVDKDGNTIRSANFKEVHDYIGNIDELIKRKNKLFTLAL